MSFHGHAAAQGYVRLPIVALTMGGLGANPNKMDEGRYKALVKNFVDQKLGSAQAPASDSEILQPVLVRTSTMGVIDGEHRVRAAIDAGWTDITVRLVDCTEEQARALRLGLNQIRGELDLSLASKDIDLLSKAGWSPDDMSLTGFSPEEITTLLDVNNDPMGPDLAAGAAGTQGGSDDDEEPSSKGWVLEIAFDDKKTYQRARRKLRKLAGQGSLADGLMRAILED